ncbi:protein SSUH2 homolog [Anneissia japonica]|uniref:protein SSUH2 homolog n=1 Tax=Anneissia japonica TaxID=1529436 RepID=UPI0014259EF5|nr:protein SSUH2 homolog [Anneissia japonica]
MDNGQNQPSPYPPGQVNQQQAGYPPPQPGYGGALPPQQYPGYPQPQQPNTVPPQGYGAQPPQQQPGAYPPTNSITVQWYGAVPPQQQPGAYPPTNGTALQQGVPPQQQRVPPQQQRGAYPSTNGALPASEGQVGAPQGQAPPQLAAWAPSSNEANEPGYKWDDGPDSDPEDDDNAQEKVTELPSNPNFTPVPGYESVMFADEKPEECHNCFSRGFVRCGRCHGRGRVRCTSCHGSGQKHVHRDGEMVTTTCHSCHGNGRKRCFRCGGDGRITCPICEGCRQLRFFIKLFINYTNHLSDYIYEKTDLPDHLIRNVNGQNLFEQTLEYVWPISQYTVPEINQNSIRITEAHRSAWPNERQLQQRQILRAVPVSEVHYKWKDVDSRFWVYGFENDVYCPDYPQTCCWGCNIL